MHDDALIDLFDRHGDVAWGLALHTTNDEVIAEQVVARAWARASRLAAGCEETTVDRWWLLRLVHLECEGAARRVRPVLGADPSDDPLVLLSRGLLALPVRRRSAWVLHELLGLRAVEIAAVLTTSEWQAQALVSEARKGLLAHFVRHQRRSGRGREVDAVADLTPA